MEWEIVEEILSRGESVRVKVRGVSMYPHFFTGDFLFLEPTQSVISGKCYLAVKGQRYAIHRCKDAQRWEFQGDRLAEPDQIPDRILAVVAKRQLTLESISKRLYYFLAKRLKRN